LKKLILDHSFTPSKLSEINQELTDLFLQEEPNEETFLNLATRRDEIVQSHLHSLSKDDINNFAKAELEVNGALVAYANKLFKASLNQLSGLIRGRKAVKKYI
jgi:hypothetical protein